MRLRSCLLTVLLSIILLPASLWAGQEDWEPMVVPENQIFPSLVVATTGKATMGSQLGAIIADGADDFKFIRLKITSPVDKCTARVVVTAKGIIDESVFEAVLEYAGLTYEIIPKINWDYDALLKMKQPKPINVVFEVFLDGQSQGKKTKTVRVRSINDCPRYLSSDEGGVNLWWMFAAYVNEDHPWVDQILREALDTRNINSFTGYLGGKGPDEVYRQVFAIWNVMQRRGLTYSNITTTSSVATIVFSQHVRFLDESVNNAQANCVDGSVLFASILRKIGIHPFLVFVPGHCFLGFYLDEAKTQIACLETTMMGHENLGDYVESNFLTDLTGLSKNNVSWRTFNAAIQSGAAQYNKNVRKFGGEDPGVQLIDIGEARRMGIMPIAFAGG